MTKEMEILRLIGIVAFLFVSSGFVLSLTLSIIKKIGELKNKKRDEKIFNQILTVQNEKQNSNQGQRVINANEIEKKEKLVSYRIDEDLGIENIKGYDWLDNTKKQYEDLKKNSIKMDVSIRKTNKKEQEQLPFNF